MVASLAEKHEQACTLPAGLPRLCDGDSGYVLQGEILADVPSSRDMPGFAKLHAHGDLGRQMRGEEYGCEKEESTGARRERGLAFQTVSAVRVRLWRKDDLVPLQADYGVWTLLGQSFELWKKPDIRAPLVAGSCVSSTTRQLRVPSFRSLEGGLQELELAVDKGT